MQFTQKVATPGKAHAEDHDGGLDRRRAIDHHPRRSPAPLVFWSAARRAEWSREVAKIQEVAVWRHVDDGRTGRGGSAPSATQCRRQQVILLFRPFSVNSRWGHADRPTWRSDSIVARSVQHAGIVPTNGATGRFPQAISKSWCYR